MRMSIYSVGFAVSMIFAILLVGSCGKPSATGYGSPAEAEALLEKVSAKYASIKSYSDSGVVTSQIDMSGVDIFPGMTPDQKKAIEASGQFKKAQKMSSSFSIKLARPDLYLIQWEQQVHPMFTNSGAVWSAGEGDFIRYSAQKKGPEKAKNRSMALGEATGISNGAANTIPTIFFDVNSGILKTLTSLEMQQPEKIEGDECFVVSGYIGGVMKAMLWISQKDLLIRQHKLFIGDYKVPNSSNTFGNEEFKNELKSMSKMKGFTLETHRNIVVDAPFKNSDFVPGKDK